MFSKKPKTVEGILGGFAALIEDLSTLARAKAQNIIDNEAQIERLEDENLESTAEIDRANRAIDKLTELTA